MLLLGWFGRQQGETGLEPNHVGFQGGLVRHCIWFESTAFLKGCLSFFQVCVKGHPILFIGWFKGIPILVKCFLRVSYPF